MPKNIVEAFSNVNFGQLYLSKSLKSKANIQTLIALIKCEWGADNVLLWMHFERDGESVLYALFEDRNVEESLRKWVEDHLGEPDEDCAPCSFGHMFGKLDLNSEKDAESDAVKVFKTNEKTYHKDREEASKRNVYIDEALDAKDTLMVPIIDNDGKTQGVIILISHEPSGLLTRNQFENHDTLKQSFTDLCSANKVKADLCQLFEEKRKARRTYYLFFDDMGSSMGNIEKAFREYCCEQSPYDKNYSSPYGWLFAVNEYLKYSEEPRSIVKEKIKEFMPLEEHLNTLSKYEDILLAMEGYNEHYIHMYKVFLIGAYILHEFKQTFYEIIYKDEDIKQAMYDCELERLWAALSLSHDCGYPDHLSQRMLVDFFEKWCEDSQPPADISFGHLLINDKFAQKLYEVCQWLHEITGLDIARIKRLVLAALIERGDHGIISAFKCWHSIEKEGDKKGGKPMSLVEILKREGKDSKNGTLGDSFFRAICLHNCHKWFKSEKFGKKITLADEPLLFLLAYCDVIQEFGRPDFPLEFAKRKRGGEEEEEEKKEEYLKKYEELVSGCQTKLSLNKEEHRFETQLDYGTNQRLRSREWTKKALEIERHMKDSETRFIDLHTPERKSLLIDRKQLEFDDFQNIFNITEGGIVFTMTVADVSS